jgi:uncharacterized membrane protein YbhN (UPF0104 family)
LAAVWYLWQYMRSNHVLTHLLQLAGASITLWLAVWLLWPLNWSLEALKWRLLARQLEPVSFGQALRAVLAGVTVGTATPNRVGESVARVCILAPEKRVAALGLAAAGSAAQLLVTSLAAVAGVLYAGPQLKFPAIHAEQVWGFAAVLAVVCVLLYFLLRTHPQGKLLLHTLTQIPRSTAFTTLLISAVRYGVYLLQFVLLLRVSGISLPFGMLAAAVAVTYGIVTLVPTFAFTEIVVRGSAAAAIIGGICGNAEAALSAAVVLWSINVGLTALAGIVPVLTFRLLKNDAHD